MMGTLFIPRGHFPFDDSRVDSVAAGADVFLAHFAQQGFVPSGAGLCGAAVAFGEAICKQPVNDKRSTSNCAGRAASSLSARITKWPSDKAYISGRTPAGVSLRRLLGAAWVLQDFLEPRLEVIEPTVVI